MESITTTEGKAYLYIEHDGKQLKTLRDLQDWYLNKVKELKALDKDFNELPFLEDERKMVIETLNEFTPSDNESQLFKNALFNYLASFLNKQLFVLTAKPAPAHDQFIDIINWFGNRLDDLKDTDLKKKFIENEIERTSKTSLDWLSKGVDLDDEYLKEHFSAGQKYLGYLKEKLTNYQHTPTASGHEPIVQLYRQYKDFVPSDEEEILLPEELENRLILEGVCYKNALSDKWMTLTFDEQYFKKFIPGTLLNEFIQAIYDRTKPLNSHEINRYLTLSLAKFDAFNPEKREKRFVEKYFKAYWYPNVMNGITESEERSAKFILKEFTPFYHLFKEATEKALADFKAGLLGAGPIHVQSPALQVQSQKLKTNLSQGELVCLFRMLHELKPAIFDIKTDTELFNFIAANFETKKTKDIGLSPGSIKNKFYTPDSKAADTWQKYLHDMLALAKKYKGF